jgi:hypothetical protein
MEQGSETAKNPGDLFETRVQPWEVRAGTEHRRDLDGRLAEPSLSNNLSSCSKLHVYMSASSILAFRLLIRGRTRKSHSLEGSRMTFAMVMGDRQTADRAAKAVWG